LQRILGYVRKAAQDFDLIQDGDRIAVGVSGGKDSLALLAALAQMRGFAELGFGYTLHALTLDPRFGGKDADLSPLERFCGKLDVPLTVIRSDIAEIVFDIRKEKNPCSLCAKMRRGALHDAAKAAGCNKIALAHSYDDAVETFVMNLFKEGRVGCFSPKTYLSRKDLTLIRPLVFAPERDIISCCRRNGFEIIKSPCPADKKTYRQEIKEFLRIKESEDKGFKHRLFTALRNGVWGSYYEN